MARRTPKPLLEMLKVHARMRDAVNQRSGHSVQERIVALQTLNGMVESLLHSHNCYAGYSHVTSSGKRIYELIPYYRSSSSQPGKRVLDPVIEYSREYHAILPAKKL